MKIKHLVFGCLIMIAACQHEKQDAHVQPLEERFQKVTLTTNLEEPMELEILPNGKILFVERTGNIKLLNPKTEKVKLLSKLNIYHGHEDGLLGVAIHPDYENNGWIYLYYSPPGDEEINRLSRFFMSGDSLLLDSEKPMLDIPVQRQECCHSAGSISFSPDGLLYLSTGDNTNPHNPGYGNSIDEREGREYWDAQRTAGNTNDLRGKILRIKPENDGTYSIPEGNLFPVGTPDTRPEIFAMGCRNPYRVKVDPKRNWVFWADVGQNTEKNPKRGPTSYDEWHLATQPGFFGWPYFAGNSQPYTHFNYETNENGEFYKVEKPINKSKNNTGLEVLPAATDALIYYDYEESKEFNYLGTGGKTPIAGPFYYEDLYVQKPAWVEDTRKFPAYYNGKVFFAEWMRDWINVATLTPDGQLDSIEQFMPSHEFIHPIDLEFGPDGALYVLEYGNNWFAANKNAGIYRIDYVEGNRKPTVRLNADIKTGAAPLTVNFSSKGTEDLDKGDELSYQWIFDGDDVQSNEENPSYTFEKPGVYQVKLIAEDQKGARNEAELEIQVGNGVPKISIDIQDNKTFYWNNYTFNYQIKVEDKEDGSLKAGTIPASEVIAHLDYTSMYPDITMAAQEHENEVSNYFHPGLEMIKKSDCMSCHSEKDASIGPSYEAIAQRYKEDAKAVETLAKKVIKGGNGNWGETAMSAHPQLAEEEVKEMIKYILSLGSAKTQSSVIASSGKVDVNIPEGEEMGSYVFSVTYKDKGGEGIGPITAKEKFVLRPAIVKAISCNDYDKVAKFNNQLIKFNWPEGYIMFKQIDLTSIKRIAFKYSSQNLPTIVRIHIDKPDGKMIGRFDLNSTFEEEGAYGSTELNANWVIVGTDIEETKGKKDIYFTFESLKVVEAKGLKQCVIDDVIFEK